VAIVRFLVNGSHAQGDSSRSLLDWLRRDAGLTSVKNGCAEGACGACMVLLDGKAINACMVLLSKIEEKSVTTVEGIPEAEMAIYAQAFAEAGAVQCGFCTPGMIISAKGLIDRNSDPSEEDVRKAIRRNICRCTGYVKIVEGILLAAARLRSGGPDAQPPAGTIGTIGTNLPRVDAIEKASGKALFTDDYTAPGMLYGKALRTPHPRARLVGIDTSEARALPGVRAVMTWQDIPGERFIGKLIDDWPSLIAAGEETRYVGDAVALVAADDPATAAKACALIHADYEVLEPVLDPRRAMEPDSPRIHPEGNILTKLVLDRGNVDKAFARSAHRVAASFETPFTEHAFMEPESALAYPPDADGIVVVRTGEQNVYDGRKYVAKSLGIPESKVRILSSYIGGGFGGKEDQSTQHHAALLAWKTGKPVKCTLTRAESLLVHPKRHPMRIDVELCCDTSGKIMGSRGRIVADTGAYASLGSPVLHRAVTHFGGPYDYRDIHVEGFGVYTNNPPAGAFRGFGVPQVNFAFESCLDLLAEKTGISPLEIRMLNAIRPGGTLPNGQIAGPDTALLECLEAVRSEYEKAPARTGLACAFKNTGIGVGHRDTGRCDIAVFEDHIELRSGAACIGQGLGTVLTQVACDTLELAPERVIYLRPDSFLTPDSGTTTASRQTLISGEACRLASLRLFEAWENIEPIGGVFPYSALAGKIFKGEYIAETDPFDSSKTNPVSHIAYSYACHLVRLGEDGKPEFVLAAHDSGRVVNPKAIEGQIEGGVVMSLGYALTEKFPLERGVPTARFGTLGLLRSTDVPKIKSVTVRGADSGVGYGAKGIGEIASIPTASATALAYHRLDGVLRTKLPLEGTPYAG